VDGWELFDLKSDPKELKNIYGDPKYKKIQDKMLKLLNSEIDRLEDTEAKQILAGR
jgi:hypothetical protein